MRPALASLAVVAALVLLGGAASAHANYVKSNPAADAQLAKSPNEIRVTFSETPDANGSDIEVLDATDTRLDKRDVHAADDEQDTLVVSVPTLPSGGYLVSWTVVSAVDGHETKGAFAFAIGDATLPTVPDIPLAPPPAPLELVGRLLSFAGVGLSIGTPFFLLFIRRPQDEREARRSRVLTVGAGVLLLTGALVTLVSYGAAAPARLLQLLGARAALGGLVAVLPLLPRIGDETRREAAAVAGLGAGLTLTLVSHAAASGDPLQVALDFVHVVSMSVWSGGVAAFVAVGLAASPTARVLGETVWRLSLTALVAVALLLTTGVLQSLDRLVLIWDLVETPYGLALLAKIALFVLLLALGTLNLLVWGPRLRRGIAARSALAMGVAAESVLFAAVLAAASYLTAAAPPAQKTAAAFDDTQRVDGVRVELLAASTIPGRNRFVVRVHQGLAPVTDAEKVALRFTMIEHDMGIQELVAEQRAPGEYSVQGSPLSMFGTWHIETIVRIAGRQDVRALFTVPVTAPQGQGATAKVLTAPPYTLIVFSDPPQPQAGAPVTINVVVVDEKGDPVSGATVRATFSGPAQQQAVDAHEDAAKTGPGRYPVEVPALDAGTWKVTISVNGTSAGDVQLEVAR